jgi:hypothetical protein
MVSGRENYLNLAKFWFISRLSNATSRKTDTDKP